MVGANAGGVEDHSCVVEAHQVNAGDSARPYRPDGAGRVVTAYVLGKVVEGAGWENRQRAPGAHRYCRRACDGSVATADAQHFGTMRGST